MSFLNKYERQKIRSLSVSRYDSWTNPPPMETLTNLFNRRPKNFTAVNLKEIEETILSRLRINEPLINHLSEPTLKRLLFSIHKGYYGNNISDLESGGAGLIVPTFMEIMYTMIFWIKDNDYKELVNPEDKEFFHKYFWCFEQYSKLMLEFKIQKSA